MKAVCINRHGGLDVLSFTDSERPKISSHEILIQTKAAALNHLDIWVREGIPGVELRFPHILGSDGAGIVTETGSLVKGFRVGDKVLINPGISCNSCEFCLTGEHSQCLNFSIMGENISGTFAEYFKVPEENGYPIPEHLSFSEAAALPLTFLTAWRLLVSKAKIKPGDNLLIIGIGGGVAGAALQIGKYAGARVFVTSGSDEKLEQAREFGADFTINHNQSDFAQEILSLTVKAGVDVVFDSVGTATWDKSFKCLKKGGRLVTCGATSGPMVNLDIRRLFWNQISIFGSTMANRREFLEMMKAVESGRLKPIVDKVYPLKDASEAIKRMEEQSQFGKIVLSLD